MTAKPQGFTLIEMVIILGMMTLLTLVTGVLFSSTLGRNQTENVTKDLVSNLRRAQWQTMNGHENVVWSVHVESDRFVLFQGTSYVDGAPTNLETNLPNDIGITTVTLNGGGVNVLFDSDYGESTTHGSIVIDNQHSEETRTVTINAVGMIDAN